MNSRAMRWAGAAFVVADTFLLQKLVRFLFGVIDSVSDGHALTGGWLDLSSGASVAVWFYWLSHVWVVPMLAGLRSPSPPPAARVDAMIGIGVAFEIVIIHFIVLTLRGNHWIISPGRLW